FHRLRYRGRCRPCDPQRHCAARRKPTATWPERVLRRICPGHARDVYFGLSQRISQGRLIRAPFFAAVHESAFGPQRTWAASFRCDAQLHITAPRFGLKCCAKDIYPYGSAICAALVYARSTPFVAGHRRSTWNRFCSTSLQGRLVELAQVRHRRTLISVRWVTLFPVWSEAGCSDRSLRYCCRRSWLRRSRVI